MFCGAQTSLESFVTFWLPSSLKVIVTVALAMGSPAGVSQEIVMCHLLSRLSVSLLSEHQRVPVQPRWYHLLHS